MARQLIGDMTSPWKAEAFEDKFTAAIHALAAQRVKAGETEKVTPVETEARAHDQQRRRPHRAAAAQSGYAQTVGDGEEGCGRQGGGKPRQRQGPRRQRSNDEERFDEERATQERRSSSAFHRRNREEGVTAARRLSRPRSAGPVSLGSGMRFGRPVLLLLLLVLASVAHAAETSRRPRRTGRASRPRPPCRRPAGSRSRPAGSTTTPTTAGGTASRSASSSPSIPTGASVWATRPGCGNARTAARRAASATPASS